MCPFSDDCYLLKMFQIEWRYLIHKRFIIKKKMKWNIKQTRFLILLTAFYGNKWSLFKRFLPFSRIQIKSKAQKLKLKGKKSLKISEAQELIEYIRLNDL